METSKLNNSDIEEIQNKVYDFAKKRAEVKGFELDEELCLIHLMEELGELSREVYNKKARKDIANENNLKEELADVILESLVLAKLIGMNTSEELNKKMEKLDLRLKEWSKSQ